MKNSFLLHIITIFSCFINLLANAQEKSATNSKPNIIVIYTDDLGYGDLSFFNKESKIKTPNLDRLAKDGVAFTDAHASSSVCTPSRYGLLTGEYSWKGRLKAAVLMGFSPTLIPEGKPTVASMLKGGGV